MHLSDRITGGVLVLLGALAFWNGSRLPAVPGQEIGPAVFPMWSAQARPLRRVIASASAAARETIPSRPRPMPPCLVARQVSRVAALVPPAL